jgi:hypothetical protein
VFGPDGIRTAGGKRYPMVHQYDRAPTHHAAYPVLLNLELMRPTQPA